MATLTLAILLLKAGSTDFKQMKHNVVFVVKKTDYFTVKTGKKIGHGFKRVFRG